MNTKPTIPPDSLRIFIGIPVDKAAQRRIDELLQPIKNARQDVRWVPASNRHLTLAFIGNIPGSVAAHLIRQFDETYQHEPRFEYKMSSLARFPDSTGRIIALVDEPVKPLNKLFHITLELLQRNKLEFDRKHLRPHITLGRIKRAKHIKTGFDQHGNIKLDIDKIVLYQSTFTASGPVYSILKQTCLN